MNSCRSTLPNTLCARGLAAIAAVAADISDTASFGDQSRQSHRIPPHQQRYASVPRIHWAEIGVVFMWCGLDLEYIAAVSSAVS